MMKTRQALTIWAAVLLLSSLHASAPAFANREPKAEPLYVKFKPNSTSATLKGVVENRQEAEYLFWGRAGQNLKVGLISNPRDPVVPRITDPDRRALQLKRDGSSRWTARLPKSGEYFMVVLRDRKGPGRATYTLTLSIR